MEEQANILQFKYFKIIQLVINNLEQENRFDSNRQAALKSILRPRTSSSVFDRMEGYRTVPNSNRSPSTWTTGHVRVRSFILFLVPVGSVLLRSRLLIRNIIDVLTVTVGCGNTCSFYPKRIAHSAKQLT